jgi:PKD repeat protein
VTGHLAIRVNAPPTAVIAADKVVAAGEDVTFDGSGSSHVGGGIIAYDWDFGDGTHGTGVEARHRYRNAGQYTARLRVTDDAGLANSSAAAELPITVNAPPTPPVSVPAKACVGDNVAFKVATQSASAGAIVAQPTWVFGGKGGESGAAVVRQFTRAGTYDITVTPDDGKQLSTSRGPTSELLRVDRPPVAVAGPERLACPGAEVAFDGSGSAAPDGKLVRYAWSFGDGGSLDGAKVVHAYAQPGTYDVKLTVTDDTGSPCASATDTTRVVVDATPIAATAPLDEAFIGGANDAALLDASPSRHPDGRALEFLWQIGDGSTETGERVRHTFRKAGDIPVKLTVRDTTGLSCGTAVQNFTVKVRMRSANGTN